MLHTHFSCMMLLSERQAEEVFGSSNRNALSKTGEHCRQKYFHFLFFFPPSVRTVPYLRRLVAEARVISRSVHTRFVVPRVTLRHVLLTDLSGLPCQHQAILPRHSSLSLTVSYRKDKRANCTNLQTNNSSFEYLRSAAKKSSSRFPFFVFLTAVYSTESLRPRLRANLNSGECCSDVTRSSLIEVMQVVEYNNILYTVHNFLMCCPSKDLGNKLHKIRLSVITLQGCEIWSLTLRQEHRLNVQVERSERQS